MHARLAGEKNLTFSEKSAMLESLKRIFLSRTYAARQARMMRAKKGSHGTDQNRKVYLFGPFPQ